MQRFLMLVAVVCTAGFVIAPTNAGEKETKKTEKSTAKTEKSTKKADFDVTGFGEKDKKTEKSTAKDTKKTEKSFDVNSFGEKETKKTEKSTAKDTKKTEKSVTPGLVMLGEKETKKTEKSTAKDTKKTEKSFDVNSFGEKETKKTEKSTSKTEKSTTKSTEKKSLTPGLELLGEKETKKTEKSTAKATEKKTEKSARISIGDKAPSFANLPNATMPGKKMGLDDCKSDVLVVCITCNHCPVAVQYEDRIINFAKKYDVMKATSKVGFVAINVNNSEQDRLPKMEERAREKGFNFPYLYDESQAIARALSATVTPEFYVFDKNRKLIYHGPLDDNNEASSAKTNLLEAAVEAGLKGVMPAVTEMKARGCGVQYQR